MTHAIKLLILLSLLAACAPKPGDQEPVAAHLQKFFEQGRLHRYWPWQASDQLSLTSLTPEIIELQELGSSPYAAWIRFDAEQMPDLPELELTQQLSLVAEKYGAYLSDLQPFEWRTTAKPMQRDDTRINLSYQREVQGLVVRDNTLQLIFAERSQGQFRLIEILSNSAGPTPADLASDDDEVDPEWLADLLGQADLSHLHSTQEWIPFLNDRSFAWHRAVVFEWLMDGEAYRATYAKDLQVWLDAYPLNVHAKPMVTRALKRSYAEGGLREYPLSFAEVQGAGGNLNLGAEAWLPEGYLPSSASLKGARVTVTDLQTPNQVSYSGLQEQEQSFLLLDDPSRLAAVNAFVAVQRMNRFVRQFLSSTEVPFLNQSLLVNVNLIEQSCNAYYSPKQQRILLYKEGGGCANMALINDVIYHEWAHALDDHVGRVAGITDPAFSEGLADVAAAYYNGDADIAPYFVFDDPRPIRSVANDRLFPRDMGPMHFEGGIIGGAFWDLRLALIDRYGQNRGTYLAGRYFFRHLLSVDTYIESYAAVLRLDDDDDNPATASPNHCLINRAFSSHGLAAAEHCQDSPIIPDATVSGDLHAALLDAGPEANAVHLLTSAPGATGMAYCWGTQQSCLVKRSEWVQLDRIGGQPERVFFRSKQAVLLPDLASLMLFSLDAADQVLGSRELKVFAK